MAIITGVIDSQALKGAESVNVAKALEKHAAEALKISIASCSCESMRECPIADDIARSCDRSSPAVAAGQFDRNISVNICQSGGRLT